MKKQKQLRVSAFIVKRGDNEDGKGDEDIFKEEKDSKNRILSRKRTRSQSPHNHHFSIFERPKVKPKQSDLLAENLGNLLDRKPQYLTSGSNDGEPVSWILHVPNWFPSSTANNASTSCGSKTNNAANIDPATKPVHDFEVEWKLHPTMRKQLKVFGRQVSEKRWSQAWGKPISYSGMIDHNDRPLDESPNLPWLIDQVNTIMKNATGGSSVVLDETTNSLQQQEDENHKDGQVNSGLVFHQYNACLQNWYRPEDSIGLHSDDETYLHKNYPIFSVSWGGPRRFLLRPKINKQKNKARQQKRQGAKKKASITAPLPEPVEVWLKDGDLLIMGGACQTTHKHEVPVPRKMDPATSNRISWTIRAIKP